MAAGRASVMGTRLARSVVVRRLTWMLGVTLATGTLSACGASGGGVAVATRAGMTTASAGSCAGLPPAAQFAAARAVFEGTFTPGSSAAIHGQQVLASPAWIKVSRYLKGHGPDLVQVQTALASVGGVDRFAEDGITPSAGQRWRIYSSSDRSPFATSACAGSAPLSNRTGAGPAGTFLYVTNTGLRTQVELVSATNGRVVRRLGSFGSSFTDNGAAVSPDRRFAYVTMVDRRAVKVVRINAATERRAVFADGAQPSVSPNGRWVAYAAGRGDAQTLAIQPTGRGATRTIGLRRLLGPQPNLLDGTVTWLGDASGVVVAPGPVLRADVGGSTPPLPPRPAGTCAAVPAPATCLIVVSVGSSGQPAQARRVVVPGLPGAEVKMAADPGLRGALLMTAWLDSGRWSTRWP